MTENAYLVGLRLAGLWVGQHDCQAIYIHVLQRDLGMMDVVTVSHEADGVMRVKELSLHGERAAIRQQAAVAVLTLLADALGLNGSSLGADDASKT